MDAWPMPSAETYVKDFLKAPSIALGDDLAFQAAKLGSGRSLQEVLDISLAVGVGHRSIADLGVGSRGARAELHDCGNA